MSRSNSFNARVDSPLIHKLKVTSAVMTLAANLTLDDDHPTALSIDPTAARDVTLPAASVANEGRVYVIFNAADAAEDMTVKNASAATVCTISQGETGVVLNIGGTWVGFVGQNT